jgi:hypothetical protein
MSNNINMSAKGYTYLNIKRRWTWGIDEKQKGRCGVMSKSFGSLHINLPSIALEALVPTLFLASGQSEASLVIITETWVGSRNY